MRENRESQPLPTTEGAVGRRGKANGRQPRMHEDWQSDSSIVPTKSANKGATALAESMEGKDGAKGNTNQQNTSRTQRRSEVPNALERVRQAAKRDRNVKFTALMHRCHHRTTAAGVLGTKTTRRPRSRRGDLDAIPCPPGWLASVVRGYFAYHAVPTNVHALQSFRTQSESASLADRVPACGQVGVPLLR